MSLNQDTGNSSQRPLFDRSQPYGVIFYPYYRVPEVSLILGIGPDKVRSLFRDGFFGEVHRVEAQRLRPRKRNYTTIFVPYQTLVRFLCETKVVA